MYALVGNPDESKIDQEQVGVAPLPEDEGQGQTASGLGGWNTLINANSQKQDEAWEFVRFMTNEEYQRFRVLKASLLPTRNSLYENQTVLDQVLAIKLGVDVLKNSRPRPVSPFCSDIVPEDGQAVQRFPERERIAGAGRKEDPGRTEAGLGARLVGSRR